MFSGELYFNTKKELVTFYKLNHPEVYNNYLKTESEIRLCKFYGFRKLLNRGNQERISKFTESLTEFNLARILIPKVLNTFQYEPNEYRGREVDFKFNNILISVKSISAKDYEKLEFKEFQKLRKEGGGEKNFQHKEFSNTSIEFVENSLGMPTMSRTETGNIGFSDSDLFQMSPVLKSLGLLDSFKEDIYKKVIFINNYSKHFHYYHIKDIANWYFELNIKNYIPIFYSDPSWYLRMFKQEVKNNNVDAIVFMCCPDSILVWPKNCFSDMIGNDRRLVVYSRDKDLLKVLDTIFT